MLSASRVSVKYVWLIDWVIKRCILNPGAGNIDFAALFQRLESSGYLYHYMMAFGALADTLVGHDYLATGMRHRYTCSFGELLGSPSS